MPQKPATLNSLTLVLTVLCAALTGYLQNQALLILLILSLALLARTIFNGLRFLITVVKPNFEIIAFSLPCLLKSFALQGLLFGTVLWAAAYGILLGVIKSIIFTNALGMPVWRR
ncbi:MAG: hypothetical protein LBB48_02245 [Treponema sp.]|nr:hypothetical protein [Treponema sp.]